MCSSRRRRIFRLHTGVNRKSCVTGWIGCTTVGVVTPVRKPVKGPKGPGHRARRSRGQRKGKRRTRGGKPQRSAPSRPPTSNVPKNRMITNKLRLLDFLSTKFRSFCRWMDRVNERKALLSRDLIYDGSIRNKRQVVHQHPRWVSYRDRWKSLRSRAREKDVVFAGAYQSSYLEFVQCRYGRFYPETDSLDDLVERMRIDIYKADKGRRKKPSIPKSVRKFPDPLAPRNSRSNTCPDCGRVAFVPALCSCHKRSRRTTKRK